MKFMKRIKVIAMLSILILTVVLKAQDIHKNPGVISVVLSIEGGHVFNKHCD